MSCDIGASFFTFFGQQASTGVYKTRHVAGREKFYLVYFSHVMQSNSLEKTVIIRIVSSKGNQGCQKHGS